MFRTFAEIETHFRTYHAPNEIAGGRPDIVKALAKIGDRFPARALFLFRDAPAAALEDLEAFGRFFAPLPSTVVPALPGGDYATARSLEIGSDFIHVHGSFDNFDVVPEISCTLAMVARRVSEGVVLAVWPAAYPGELAALFGRREGDHFTGKNSEWVYKFGG